MEKKVIALYWSSQDGQIFYRPVYEDGTKGEAVFIGMEADDPRFRRRKHQIESELIWRKNVDKVFC